jgi:hypothetical protein
MSGEDPGHRKTGWWEDLDTSETDAEDLDLSVEELIEERTEDRWDIRSIMLADRDGATLYCIVIRSGVGGDGQLLLDERYFNVDLEDPWGESSGYSSNGICRRINGEGAMLGLKVAFTALADSGLDIKRQVTKAANGELVYNAEELSEPMDQLLGIDGDESEETSESAPEPVETSEPERKGWVRCTKCGETLREDDATLFSDGPPLGEVWVHPAGDCPDQEEEESR